MPKLLMRHLRACAYCVPGVIAFCKSRGIDHVRLFKDGIELDDLPVILKGEKHTLIERAVALVIKENTKDG